MKRIYALLLALILLFVFCGCQNTVQESSSAESTFTRTEEPTSSPSPSPTPEPTPEPTPAPLQFALDPHKLPADQAEYLDEIDAADAWDALIDAVYANRSTVMLSNAASAERAALVFAASPYGTLADLTVTDAQIRIAYTGLGDAEALDSAVNTFVTSVLLEDHNTPETMLSLYRAVASGHTYEESEDGSLYRMLVEKKGNAKSFAAALQFLFAQLDIPAWLTEGEANGFTHYWVIAEFEGKRYHFDPAFENTATAGLGLSYFGMSDAAHIETGCAAEYVLGFDTLSEMYTELCINTGFDILFLDVTDWKLDTEAHTLFVAYGTDAEYLTSFSTESFLDTVD